MSDPCLSCSLPDCDDGSPRCNVRRLYRNYCAKIKRGEKQLITEEERAAMNRHFELWHLERAAEASEGGRPYVRNGIDYGPERAAGQCVP